MAFIEFDKVSKIYRSGQVEIAALREASFEIEKGELCVIVGQSGAGKTTLTKLLLRLSDVQEGRILVDGQDISETVQKMLVSTVEGVTLSPGILYFFNPAIAQSHWISQNRTYAFRIGGHEFYY